MKHVYIVITGERYQGGRVLGVYSSMKKAQTRLHTEANALCVRRDMSPQEIEWDSDVLDEQSYFRSGIDWWSVTVKEVE